MKEAAKKGDKAVCIILAKEIIGARKTINKIHTSKAHLNSIQMQMKNQLCKYTFCNLSYNFLNKTSSLFILFSLLIQYRTKSCVLKLKTKFTKKNVTL